MQALQYLLFVLKYSILKNYSCGIRLPDLNHRCISYQLWDHVSYFQFPHLKNGNADDDAGVKLRVIMRSKSVTSPSQLILFLTRSKHSINISYYNYLLSPFLIDVKIALMSKSVFNLDQKSSYSVIIPRACSFHSWSF